MSTRASYPPGVPCWVAVLAPDTDVACRFYTAVLGWQLDNIAAADDPPFYIATVHGDRVASITGPEQPGSWITAVSVNNIDDTVQVAIDVGGTAPGPTIDIPTLGSFHRLHDPDGAEIHVMQPGRGRGADRINERGAWSMSSLTTTDPDLVAPFYQSVFGWETEQAGPVTLFRLPGYTGGEPDQPVPRDVIATLERTTGDTHPVWTPDFWVADSHRTVAIAEANGGQVISTPQKTDTGFLTAVLADPGGARFIISQLLDEP